MNTVRAQDREVTEKYWGYEELITNTDKYCGKRLVLKEGYRCSLHYHKIKDETFYILSGEMHLELDDERVVLNTRDSIRILPGQKHRFSAPSSSVTFIEVSMHHEDNDSYREVPSSVIPKQTQEGNEP